MGGLFQTTFSQSPLRDNKGHNLPQLQRAPIMFGWFIKSYKINVKVLKINQVGVLLPRQVLSLLYREYM